MQKGIIKNPDINNKYFKVGDKVDILGGEDGGYFGEFLYQMLDIDATKNEFIIKTESINGYDVEIAIMKCFEDDLFIL